MEDVFGTDVELLINVYKMFNDGCKFTSLKSS
jgi:hypothetical protein